MALVLIATTSPLEDLGAHAYHALRAKAVQDLFGVHRLTEDAEEADLILFAEYCGDQPFVERLRRHPYIQKYREKCFCISERDHTFPFLPGVYTSIPRKWYRSDRMRSGFYVVMHEDEYIQPGPPEGGAPYLFSFVGDFHTHQVRTSLKQLSHPSALLEDTTGKYDRSEHQRRRYADILRRSAFVLCPRGWAPASARLFHTMQAGRVPVIIADEWVEPVGPRWEAFSIRVPERDVSGIPALLEAYESRAAEMGALARQEWEKWFSSEVTFHRIVEWCHDIKKERPLPESLLRTTALRQLLSQPYRYNYYRSRLDRFRHEGKLVL